MFDSNFKLYDAARNDGANVDVTGNTVNLGRRGLPSGTQFIAGIDNPGGTAGDAPLAMAHLQITLNNGTNWRNVATISFGKMTDGFQGQRVVEVGQDLNPQEYGGANIDMRVLFTFDSTNNSNNSTADRIWAYLGYGEKSYWGRKATADTLFSAL